MTRILVSAAAMIYGPTRIGKDSRIEAFAIIGRPTEDRLQTESSMTGEDIDGYYDRVSHGSVIGHSVILRSSCVIYQDVTLGDFTEIGHGTVVREGVTIGNYCRVWPLTSIRPHVKIGHGSRIAGTIGDRSVIGAYVTCLGTLVHDYKIGVGGEIEPAPTIGRGAVVSRGAVVVGEVSVGEFAFVAAGAVVRRDVAAASMVAGDPARVVGRRSDEDIARVIERITKGEYL